MKDMIKLLTHYFKYYLVKDVQMVFAMLFFLGAGYLFYERREASAIAVLILAVILILTRGLTKAKDDCNRHITKKQ